MNQNWEEVPLSSILKEVSRPVRLEADQRYRIIGMKWYAKGVYIKQDVLGSAVSASTAYRVETGDIVYNRLFAWKGSFGIVGEELSGSVGSNEFPTFRADPAKVDLDYLRHFLSREAFWAEVERISQGSSRQSRLRLKEAQFLGFKIALPPIDEQRRIVDILDKLTLLKEKQDAVLEDTVLLIHSTLDRAFSGRL